MHQNFQSGRTDSSIFVVINIKGEENVKKTWSDHGCMLCYYNGCSGSSPLIQSTGKQRVYSVDDPYLPIITLLNDGHDETWGA